MAETKVTEQQVIEALSNIIDPDLHRDIVSLGFVKNIKICGGNVAFTIELTTPACPVKEQFKQAAVKFVSGIPGVQHVEVNLTANVQRQQRPLAEQQEDLIPGVKITIAVTSGKGGVGKSTVAVNLAVALQQTGARVGLLDADVYGPSIPTMFGVPATERPTLNENEQIVPIDRGGIPLMSIGFLVEPDAAMIMRGPMLAKFVQDALARVDWGELDYLIIDLPPGTGDVQLTLAQTIPLTGAVVVTTPQKVALADVRRAVTMCEKLNVPVLGIIENMSDPVGPDGRRTPMFGSGGGAQAADEWGVEFLGEVGFDANVPASGDRGRPIVTAQTSSPAAQALATVAGRVAAAVSARSAQPAAGPTIRMAD